MLCDWAFRIYWYEYLEKQGEISQGVCNRDHPCICKSDATSPESWRSWRNPFRALYPIDQFDRIQVPVSGAHNYLHVWPTFVDLTNDGTDELVLGHKNGALAAFINEGGNRTHGNWQPFVKSERNGKGLGGMRDVNGPVTAGTLCGQRTIIAIPEQSSELIAITEHTRCDLAGSKQRSCHDSFAGFCPDPLRVHTPVCECFPGYNNTYCDSCSQGYGRAADGFCKPCT